MLCQSGPCHRPYRRISATVKANMQENSEEFGILFQTISIEADENSILSLSLTKFEFDVAVAKFGQNKVLEVLQKAMMKPVNDYCNESINPISAH